VDLQDYEDIPKRQQRAIKIGQLYTRVYNVPEDDAANLIPARGDAVDLNDVDSPSALLTPRVLRNPRRKQNDDGSLQVTITLIQPEAYA